MPRYTPSEEDMEGLYPNEESPSGKTTEENPESGMESVDEEEESSGSKTALIDNKILSPDGKSPQRGDKITLEVVKCYDGECEVKYASASGGKVQPPGNMMDEANEELDAMNEE